MQTYKATFRMRAPTGTPWHADTIFGHLCWTLRYLDGEGALEELFDSYRADAPAFVVSNGFPGDWLPRPLRKATAWPDTKDLVGRVEEARRAKDVAAIQYLTLDEFNLAIRGDKFEPTAKTASSSRVMLKNQINRMTGTTGGGEGGQLFELVETFWETVSVYIKLGTYLLPEARRLIEAFAEVGYGKRKGVGYGEVEQVKIESFDGFDIPADASGFVSLSNFVPARSDPRQGFWRTMVKYGKLGEEFALEASPFKRPLIMLEAGSCFYDPTLRPFYGRLVPGVSTAHPQVVQYGLAFAVPMRLPVQQEVDGI